MWLWLDCGGTYTAALKTDGSLWTWGENDHGELGNGGLYDHEAKQPYPLPVSKKQFVPLKIMDGVDNVWCMSHFTVIQKTDGSIWCCGQANNSPFPDILREGANVPVKTAMRDVVSFGDLSYLTKDGSLWMWGFAARSDTPVKMMDHVSGVSYTTNGNGYYLLHHLVV